MTSGVLEDVVFFAVSGDVVENLGRLDAISQADAAGICRREFGIDPAL
jgi:hypothetical protein